MAEPDRDIVDATRASPARMYDYWLGGSHNLPPDRAAAEAVTAVAPHVPLVARANRAFLERAVRYLVAAGMRQFLDIGSGIPTQNNVHQVAQGADLDCCVVYVDIDPVAAHTALGLLSDADRATAVVGDLSQPDSLLEQLDTPEVQQVIDFDQPVALLLVAMLHFLPDEAQPYEAVARLTARLSVGSYLVISHGAAEAFTDEERRRVQGAYRRGAAPLPTSRTREEVARFLGPGFELVPPGVVAVPQWPSPEQPVGLFAENPVRSGNHAVVGRKVRNIS